MKIKEAGKAAPLTIRASLCSGLRPSRRLARMVSPAGNHGRRWIEELHATLALRRLSAVPGRRSQPRAFKASESA